MDEKQFNLIRYYVGTELIKYSINYNENIDNIPFQNIKFAKNQLESLEITYKLIKDVRHNNVKSDCCGDDITFFYLIYILRAKKLLTIAENYVKESFQELRRKTGY